MPRSSLQTPLPLSGAGKILKRELRKPYWENRQRMVSWGGLRMGASAGPPIISKSLAKPRTVRSVRALYQSSQPNRGQFSMSQYQRP